MIGHGIDSSTWLAAVESPLVRFAQAWAQAFDSAGQRYYPVSGFDEDTSLRWQVSAGPTDGTGTAEPDIRTLAVEATYLVRYTAGGAPITGENSLGTSFGTLLTE